ncbi:MAG TPA: DUF177 domain-containing protein [Anaerolineales bacterium]|nr:DUF177 domain-containing protein [Anaerolineales bacterium]
MSNTRHELRLNLGFILHEEVGYSYDYSFDLASARLGEDLEVNGLSGNLAVGRTAQGLLFSGRFAAGIELTCVRCLSIFEHGLAWSLTEHYAMNERSLSESGLLIPEDAQVDLRPLLREYALLEVPINPICRPDCRGLCPVCGQDLNERDCGHRREEGNSSFAALRDFLRE